MQHILAGPDSTAGNTKTGSQSGPLFFYNPALRPDSMFTTSLCQ